jgi:hypothetical protein
MTMKDDVFAAYRASTPLYDSVTADDGLTLTLRAVDVAAFHGTAHEVIALANRSHWRVHRLHHAVPGGNIAELTVSPNRR